MLHNSVMSNRRNHTFDSVAHLWQNQFYPWWQFRAQRASKKVDEVSEKSKKMVKSMSREEWSGAKELEETSDDMRAKSRLLLSR